MRHVQAVPLMKERFRLGYAYFNPLVFGLDQLDLSRPALFVGNHTLYGVLDVPFIISEIYQQHQVVVRSLGDSFHFRVPLWRDMLTAYGMVLGNPANCTALMQQGESVLVFPGGAREVMRRRDEKYSLIWKRRTGFARMAIQNGYDIIPFASVGADDCFDILYDADDLQRSNMLRPLLGQKSVARIFRNGDVLPPMVRGLGPTLLPRPQRFYFSFGQRISSAEFGAGEDDLWALREQVAERIEMQITSLLDYREQDRLNWSMLRKTLT